MYFDLQSPLIRIDHAAVLEEPFSKEEIDSIIQLLPTEKSPGPDGFNGEFLKKTLANIIRGILCFMRRLL
jgi:hypothetical protein